jgi:hypothetical protein
MAVCPECGDLRTTSPREPQPNCVGGIGVVHPATPLVAIIAITIIDASDRHLTVVDVSEFNATSKSSRHFLRKPARLEPS